MRVARGTEGTWTEIQTETDITQREVTKDEYDASSFAAGVHSIFVGLQAATLPPVRLSSRPRSSPYTDRPCRAAGKKGGYRITANAETNNASALPSVSFRSTTPYIIHPIQIRPIVLHGLTQAPQMTKTTLDRPSAQISACVSNLTASANT